MKPRDGNPPTEPLGERIKRLRQEKGWTQRDLALRAGLEPSRISRYERGHLKPSRASLKAIEEALGTTAGHLPGGSEPTTEADARLKNLLSQVDELPAEQRSNLAEFLEALLKIHRYLDTQSLSSRPHKPEKT